MASIELSLTMGFRREEYCRHPWWGDLIGEHPEVAEDLRRRIRDDGPLRSLDMDGGRLAVGSGPTTSSSPNATTISPCTAR